MSDEESDLDITGAHYLTVRAPKFRPPIIKDLFDCLDKLDEKLADRRKNLLLHNPKPKYERCPAEDGMASEQPPPRYLPRDCYDAEWLVADPLRTCILQPAPAMGIQQMFEAIIG